MKLLPIWTLTKGLPAFNDAESATVIEQTYKIYKAMNELITEYNAFAESVNKKILDHENKYNDDMEVFTTSLRQEFQDFIGEIDLKVRALELEIEKAGYYDVAELITEVNNIKEILSNVAFDVVLDVESLPDLTEIKYNGTTIPNTGYVNSIYLNKELSIDEVVKLLKTLPYKTTEDEEVLGYDVAWATDRTKWIRINYILPLEIYSIMSGNEFIFVSDDYDDGVVAFSRGWQTELDSILFEKELDSNYGESNYLISDLLSCEPFSPTEKNIQNVLYRLPDGKIFAVNGSEYEEIITIYSDAFKTLETTITELNNNFATIQTTLQEHQEGLDYMDGRIAVLEGKNLTLETETIPAMNSHISGLTEDLRSLEEEVATGLCKEFYVLDEETGGNLVSRNFELSLLPLGLYNVRINCPTAGTYNSLIYINGDSDCLIYIEDTAENIVLARLYIYIDIVNENMVYKMKFVDKDDNELQVNDDCLITLIKII